MGVEFDALTERQVVTKILDAAQSGRGGWVVTPNVDVLRQCHGDPDVRRLAEMADLVVADGMPLVWAAKLLGAPLPARVPGSSLIWTLPEEAARRKASIFLLGGSPGVAVLAARRLQAEYPGLAIAGTLSPPRGFEADPRELGRIDDALERANPDVVFVGLPCPKQERLIAALRGRFPAMWFLGIGVALSFVAGEIPRAPSFVQRAGFEWLYRLIYEPHRLFRRYVLHDMPFAVKMLVSVLVARLSR